LLKEETAHVLEEGSLHAEKMVSSVEEVHSVLGPDQTSSDQSRDRSEVMVDTAKQLSQKKSPTNVLGGLIKSFWNPSSSSDNSQTESSKTGIEKESVIESAESTVRAVVEQSDRSVNPVAGSLQEVDESKGIDFENTREEVTSADALDKSYVEVPAAAEALARGDEVIIGAGQSSFEDTTAIDVESSQVLEKPHMDTQEFYPAEEAIGDYYPAKDVEDDSHEISKGMLYFE